MTKYEKLIIHEFAAGHKELRKRAIAIYRRYISTTTGGRRTLEQNFMAEIDTPVPDLNLRSIYRRKIVENEQDEQNKKTNKSKTNKPKKTNKSKKA